MYNKVCSKIAEESGLLTEVRVVRRTMKNVLNCKEVDLTHTVYDSGTDCREFSNKHLYSITGRKIVITSVRTISHAVY